MWYIFYIVYIVNIFMYYAEQNKIINKNVAKEFAAALFLFLS